MGSHLPIGAGHIVQLPNFADNAPRSLKKLLAEDPAVVSYLNTEIADLEKQDA